MDTITEIRTDREISTKVAAATNHVAATTARLTAYAAALDEVAEQVRNIRGSWPAAS